MATRPQPVRIYSCGNAYRYNRMQRGRLREFVQFDVEAIGSDDPAVDAEIIALQMRWLTRSAWTALELEINSIDTPAARRAYVAELRHTSTRTRASCRRTCCGCATSTRCARSTPRTSARAPCSPRRRRSPTGCPRGQPSTSRRCAPSSTRAASPTASSRCLVRGLDYYTHTAWEIKWPPLGAQSHGLRRRALRRLRRDPGRCADAGHRVRGGDRPDRAGAPGPGPGRRARRPSLDPDLFAQITVAEARPRLHALLDELRLAGVPLRGRSRRSQREGPVEARRAARRAADRPVRARRVGGRYGSAAGSRAGRHRAGGARGPRARRRREDRERAMSMQRPERSGGLAMRFRMPCETRNECTA